MIEIISFSLWNGKRRSLKLIDFFMSFFFFFPFPPSVWIAKIVRIWSCTRPWRQSYRLSRIYFCNTVDASILRCPALRHLTSVKKLMAKTWSPIVCTDVWAYGFYTEDRKMNNANIISLSVPKYRFLHLYLHIQTCIPRTRHTLSYIYHCCCWCCCCCCRCCYSFFYRRFNVCRQFRFLVPWINNKSMRGPIVRTLRRTH